MGLKEISKKISAFFVPDTDEMAETVNGIKVKRLKNRQELVNAIFNHFVQRFEEQTTDESMLFPTNFLIYINQADYNRFSEAQRHVVFDAVAKFHRYIRQKRESYPRYKPHSPHWRFQFVPIVKGNLIDGIDESQMTEPISVITSIYPPKEKGASGGGVQAAVGEHMVSTVHNSKNSRTMDNWAINTDDLLGVNIVDKDCFTVMFNDFADLVDGDVKSDAEATAAKQYTRAKIHIYNGKFLVNSRPCEAINMISDRLQVSGPGGRDTSGGIMVVRIDNPNVMNDQLMFRYDAVHKRLFMSAIGSVKINEVPFDSETKNDAGEVLIPLGSKILLNEEIQLKIVEIAK